jgi:hypothetical protein
MLSYTLPNLDQITDYKSEYAAATAIASFAGRKQAYLAIRIKHRDAFVALENETSEINDPYVATILINSLLNCANQEPFIEELQSMQEQTAKREAEYKQNKTAKLLQAFSESKIDCEIVTTLPQKMVAALHMATLGHYDPSLSIRENKMIADRWIKSETEWLDNRAVKTANQPI